MLITIKQAMGVVVAACLIAPCTAFAVGDEETFFEISLRCPELRGGTLQLTKMNRGGLRDRITIVYDDDAAVGLELAVAGANGDFETFFTSSSPEAETDADAKEMSDSLLARFGVLRRGICLAPQRERDRYFRVLERQKHAIER